MSYRFYSYVAGGYISELQKGLQTGHSISRMSVKYDHQSVKHQVYEDWARNDETIIICSVFNSAGVIEQFQKLCYWLEQCEVELPISIFYEDEQSLGGAATSCSVVVPSYIFDAVPTYQDNRLVYYTVTRMGESKRYYPADDFFELLKIIRTPPKA